MNAHTRADHGILSPRIIFLNASTIATAALLLNSISTRFPNGLGNTSGQVGHNLMDHFHRHRRFSRIRRFAGHDTTTGRKPTGYLCTAFPQPAREDNNRRILSAATACQGNGTGRNGRRRRLSPGFGTSFKDHLTTPGPWIMWMGAWAETLPYYDNKITLDKDKKDQWGLPARAHRLPIPRQRIRHAQAISRPRPKKCSR